MPSPCSMSSRKSVVQTIFCKGKKSSSRQEDPSPTKTYEQFVQQFCWQSVESCSAPHGAVLQPCQCLVKVFTLVCCRPAVVVRMCKLAVPCLVILA